MFARGSILLTPCELVGLIGRRPGKKTAKKSVAKRGPTIGEGQVVAVTGAIGAAARATSPAGIKKGSEIRIGNEGIATMNPDTVTVTEIEIMKETVVGAGVKKTEMTSRRTVTRGSVARKVQMKLLLTPLLGTAHAGAPRELIPEIVMVIDVPGILAIPEMNSTTCPDTGGIVGHHAVTSAALTMLKNPLGASRPHLRWRTSFFLRLVGSLIVSSHFRRKSPTYEPPPDDPMNDEPREDDSEARSVFVSQLAARLTARDLGYFFEDKLGENTVLDARIVTDRLSRRSKGLVCFASACPLQC